jgi:hypothetical protein
MLKPTACVADRTSLSTLLCEEALVPSGRPVRDIKSQKKN